MPKGAPVHLRYQGGTAGGTGFLGTNLARYLVELGCDVVLLGRRQPSRATAGRFVFWDARTLGDWVAELDGAAALVDFAGRSVDCVKTPDPCDEILRSRVESTLVLGQALRVPFGLPSPGWLIRLGAPLMRTDPELALYGRYCVSRRLHEGGFAFLFPEISSALMDLYGTARSRPSVPQPR